MAKKKLRKGIKALIIVGSVVVGLLSLVGGVYLSLQIMKDLRKNTDPEHVDPIEGGTLVFQKNRSLYDKDGNILRLRGVNAGNVLVTEGWIAPYSCGPELDDKGNIVKDSNGDIVYPDLTQEEVEQALTNNPNLSDEQRIELVDVYRKNWMSSDDFVRIKEEFHMNAIRLPFYWRNILDEVDGNYVRKSEEEAFGYLDWFMEQCKKNDIYCILDLHGAVKTQNGYEHSGSEDTDMLWDNEEAIVATCDLWAYVADHYKDNPLGEAIATYDLLNEPCGNYQGATQDNCYPVFNRLYQAIRNTGDNHVITVEGCWSYDKFVTPKRYGWQNVQYEIHLYNWPWLHTDYDTFFNGMEATRIGHDYNVPYFVGEFTFFSDDYKVWEKWLGYYDRLGYSWTLWTYKKTVTGWWNDNWGLYDYRLYLDNKKDLKVDLRTATYAELKPVLECSNTTNCYKSISGDNVSKYLSEH